MHQRAPSHSVRIPVAPSRSSPTSPSSPSQGHAPGFAGHFPPPRKRHNSDEVQQPLLSPGWYGYGPHDAAGWISQRLGSVGHGGSGTAGGSRHLVTHAWRRYLVFALALGASYVLVAVVVSSSASATAARDAARANPSAASRWNPISWWTSGTTARHSEDLNDWLQPPRVDRSALEKLRLLEIHYGADDEEEDERGDGEGARDDGSEKAGAGDESRPGDGADSRGSQAHTDAPPLVAAIPDFVKPNPLAPPAPEKLPTEVLDRRVCGGTPCRFLVPAWLGEQETKAQQHLYQLGLLALALNRTLVLPNVSKSRLGTCYKNPFSFYYAASSLSDLGIPTISQEDFIDWTLRRDAAPTAQVVTMSNAKPDYSLGAIEIDSAADPTLIPSKPTRNLCLRAPRTRLDFAPHSPLSIYPPDGYHRSEAGRLGFGESVITTLRSRKVVSKSSRLSSSSRAPTPAPPDVLAFNYELRFPILSPLVAGAFAPPSLPEAAPFSHFPYSDVWSSLGEQLVSRLSPFVAIHWRTETLTPANLAPCGKSLLDKLLELKREHPSLQNVYLATDYPIESLDPSLGPVSSTGAPIEVAHSGTFAKVVTAQHHAAMKQFLRDFERQAKGQLRLTTFAKEQGELAAEAETALPSMLATDLVDLVTPSLRPKQGAPGRDQTTAQEPVTAAEAITSLARIDSGLYGILDKLVAMRAELFVTGTPGVGSSTVGACAKLSSFTNQLIAAREDSVAQGGTGLWNTVEHFELGA